MKHLVVELEQLGTLDRHLVVVADEGERHVVAEEGDGVECVDSLLVFERSFVSLLYFLLLLTVFVDSEDQTSDQQKHQ